MSDDGKPTSDHAGKFNGADSSRPEVGTNRGVLILAAALLLMRLGFQAFPDLYPEEAYYWNYSMHLDIGYLDHPPMVAWLIRLGTTLFGGNEFGVRLGTLPCSLVTSFFVYQLTLLLFNARAACHALLLVQVLPFFFLTGFMITPDSPLTACWAGTLYFLAQALLRARAAAWLGVGVCLGLGMLSKYTIALLGPATLLFITLDAPSRKWWRHPAPYASTLLAAVIFSPVIIWNYRHEWASFAFQSVDRVAERRHFSLHELLGTILVLLSPIGALLAWKALRGPRNVSRDEPRRQLFARVYTLVPLSVFLVFSLTHRVKLNWTGPLWLAIIPTIGAGLAVMAAAQAAQLRRAWNNTLVFLPIGYATFLIYLSCGLPGIGYAENMALMPVGWSEMGRALEARRAVVPVPAGGRVLLVGLDRNFIASEAAFYHSRQSASVRETTGAHLFGGHALMYEFWFPLREQRGATLLLVTFNRDQLDRPIVRERCATLGNVEDHWIERGGRKIRRYFTRVAEDYQPP